MREDRTRTAFGKMAATFLLFVLGIGLALPFLLARPKPAYAFPTEDIVTETQTTVVNVFSTLKDNLVEGAVSALVSGASYFLSKMAYELAVSLTSDCPGQSVCWDSSNLKDGLKDAWQGALGEAVGTLSEEGGFSEIGFNLCAPSNPLSSMRIQVGLLDAAGAAPAKPRCSFQSIRDNWSSLSDQFTSGEALQAFMPQFSPGQSGLSVALGVFGHTQKVESDALVESTLKRITQAAAGGGFSDVADPVSGRILSPSSVVKTGFERMENEKEEAPRKGQETTSAGQIAKGAVLSVVINTVKTFVSTFISRLWNKFTSGLLSAEETISAQPGIILSEEGLFRPPGRKTSREVLTRLLTPPSKEVGEVDPLLNFTICPPTGRLPDNCVMDSQFANAVRIAGATPFTVRQAIDEGYLHGDWSLVPASDSRDQDPFCYATGYCESNLKRLRSVRVLPLGWEIAASQSHGSYSNFTLQDAVESFHDCNAEGERDSRHPFCNLINPEWVLKVPPAQCRIQAFGSSLLSPEIPRRLEECVDYRTCLKQDDFGNCVGGWGYCVRDRNAWRFNGDQCPAQFNTCRTLNPAKGGIPVSYLMNTVDFGVCNADNVGCQSYATDLNMISCHMTVPCEGEGGVACGVGCTIDDGEDSCNGSIGVSCSSFSPCDREDGCLVGCEVANGQVSCSSVAGLPKDKSDDWLVQPARFFNDKVESCDVRDVGCTSLIKLAPGESLNMMSNSGFESQDDVDRDGQSDRPTGWLMPTGSVPDDRTGFVLSNEDLVPLGRNAVLLAPDVGGVGTCNLAVGRICDDVGGCVCISDSEFTCLVQNGDISCNYGGKLVHDFLSVRPGQLNTVSGVFVSSEEGRSASGQIVVRFYDEAGERVNPGRDVPAISTFSHYIQEYDSSVGGTDPCRIVGGDGNGELLLNFVAPENVNEIRAACSFYVKDSRITQAIVEYRGSGLPGGGNVYLDAVQFEEGPLTPYHEGYSSRQVLSVKLAPAYLECTGEPNDRPECDSFARVCRENEIGCERFTPTNGDPSIPGIVSDQDYCPAECSGYDMFFQEETDFEAQPDEADNFIPATAQQCSAIDVGCTSFTNLENEQVEHFSRLRICSSPDDRDVETFYTWEGSDLTGYQLRSWSLKNTALDAPQGFGVDLGPGPIAEENKMTDICLDGSCGKAPCVRLDPGNSNRCIDNPVAIGDRSGFCSQEDIANGDYDCREFYDSGGSRHYRRFSSTIIASADCSRYRLAGRTEEDCLKWNGDYDRARGECIYRASASWSWTCSAAAAGCRSYRGNAATNVQTVFVDDFESEIAERWSSLGRIGFEQSSESIVVGGHSLRLQGGSATRKVGGSVSSGNLFSVSFWARGNGSVTASMVQVTSGTCSIEIDGEVLDCRSVGGCPCNDSFGHACVIASGESSCEISPVDMAELAIEGDREVEITNDWRRYEVGPIRLNTFSPVPGTEEALRLSNSGGGGAPDVFLDNVIFTRVRDNISVVRDSWRTPDSCDRTYNGVYSPLEMLGCREYRTSQPSIVHLRSISNLCRDVSVGCSAYSDTQNTPDSFGPRTYGAVCRMPDGPDPDALPDTCSTSPNCPCDYRVSSPVDVVGVGRSKVLKDVCRVPAGETECRFVLDGIDVSGESAEYPDRFVLPGDERVHLVVRAKDACSSTAVGCRNLGMPTIDFERQCSLLDDDGKAYACPDSDGCSCPRGSDEDTMDCLVPNGRKSCYVALDEGVISGWKATVVKVNPSNYDQTLCQADAVGCQAFKASDGVYYLKHPGNQVCEFKTNIQVDGRVTSGWFRKSSSGSVFPCYEDLLVEGATFGIYRNRDTTYTGWVGACSAEYDRCEEFQDPNDPLPNGSSRAYYYLDNNKLDRASCGGQVSLSRGCVLLNQTSKTKTDYSSAATYFRSEREAGGGPVSPVSCQAGSGGSSSQNCTNRCLAVTHFCAGTSTECEVDADCADDAVCGSYERWGNGCLEDSDCDIGLGESCILVESGSSQFGNDTNTVLKVRQDRECAEWLECDQYSLPIYDSVKGRWTARCAGIDTCQNNMRIGDNYVCTDFKEVPKEILTADEYASRDTSWRGLEYSGYSIIDRYPPQFMRAYKIITGQCLEGSSEVRQTGDGSIVVCRSVDQCHEACASGEADCDATEVRCSAPLAGICISGDLVGHSCNDDSHCTKDRHFGQCSLSEFDTVRFGIQLSFCRQGDNIGERCASDKDCYDAGEVVVGSKACSLSCTQDEVTPDGRDGCPSDGYGIPCTGVSCPTSHGTCMENSCVYDYRGGPLRTDGWDNALSCRAYPEADSPYPQDVLNVDGEQVKSLEDYGATPGYDANGNPVQKQAQFRGANVCYEGNSCECSYSRVGYGSGNSKVRFQSPDRSIRYRDVPGVGSVGDFKTGSPAPGVCVNGPYDGRSCVPGETEQCGPANEGGACLSVSSYTVAMGWPGFCVDRNETRALFGSDDKLGCNLWLPLDVIPGLFDSYSYHPEAGFQSSVKNLMYCAASEGSAYRSCSNDINKSCVNDAECAPGTCVLRYIRHLRGAERADGGDIGGDHAVDPPDIPIDHNLFQYTDVGRESCNEGRRGDCNTFVCDQTYLPHLPGVTSLPCNEPFSIDQPLDALAGIAVTFMNRGTIWMTPDNGWGFALHWSGEEDYMAGGNLQEYDYEGHKYIKNQALEDETGGLDCLDWLETRDSNGVDSPCRNSTYNLSKQNCIAARAIEVDDGVFKKTVIETVLCHGASTLYHWVPVKLVDAYLRESCLEIEVVNDQNQYPPNVAWTDRLYDLRNGRSVTALWDRLAGLAEHYSVGPPALQGLYAMGLDHTPLGAIVPQFDPESDSFAQPIPLVRSEEGDDTAGSPYTRVVQDDTAQTVVFQAPDLFFGRDIAAGLTFSCGNGLSDGVLLERECITPQGLSISLRIKNNWFSAADHWNLTHSGQDKIKELFAYEYFEYNWSSGASYLSSGPFDHRIEELVADTDFVDHQPPRIVPADTESESCIDDGRVCPEMDGVDGITVDGHQDDICYEGGYATNVELAYYVYADSNHMPIRRHVVDYGDGTKPLRMDGAFKNRRGLDSSGQQVCGSDSSDWGLNSDACDPNYMSFKKTYVCNEATVASLDKCAWYADGDHYPCVDSAGCCIFRPRVQALDNWGICNGVCNDSVEDEVVGDLCFNSVAQNFLAESREEFDDVNECFILENDDQTYGYSDTRRPYTAYQGEIRVCPGGCSGGKSKSVIYDVDDSGAAPS